MVEKREERANDHIPLTLCRVAFPNHPRLQISHTPTHLFEEESISVEIVSNLHSFSQLPVKALTTHEQSMNLEIFMQCDFYVSLFSMA